MLPLEIWFRIAECGGTEVFRKLSSLNRTFRLHFNERRIYYIKEHQLEKSVMTFLLKNNKNSDNEKLLIEMIERKVIEVDENFKKRIYYSAFENDNVKLILFLKEKYLYDVGNQKYYPIRKNWTKNNWMKFHATKSPYRNLPYFGHFRYALDQRAYDVFAYLVSEVFYRIINVPNEYYPQLKNIIVPLLSYSTFNNQKLELFYLVLEKIYQYHLPNHICAEILLYQANNEPWNKNNRYGRMFINEMILPYLEAFVARGIQSLTRTHPDFSNRNVQYFCKVGLSPQDSILEILTAVKYRDIYAELIRKWLKNDIQNDILVLKILFQKAIKHNNVGMLREISKYTHFWKTQNVKYLSKYLTTPDTVVRVSLDLWKFILENCDVRKIKIEDKLGFFLSKIREPTIFQFLLENPKLKLSSNNAQIIIDIARTSSNIKEQFLMIEMIIKDGRIELNNDALQAIVQTIKTYSYYFNYSFGEPRFKSKEMYRLRPLFEMVSQNPFVKTLSIKHDWWACICLFSDAQFFIQSFEKNEKVQYYVSHFLFLIQTVANKNSTFEKGKKEIFMRSLLHSDNLS